MQEIKRLLPVCLHFLLCICYAARLLHIFYYLVYLGPVCTVVLHYIYDPALCGGIRMLERIDKRQGHFLFFYVYTCRFTYVILSVIEKVIFYLKGYTHLLAKKAEVFGNRIISSSRPRPC